MSKKPSKPGWWWVRSGREVCVDGWVPVEVRRERNLVFQDLDGATREVHHYAWGGQVTRPVDATMYDQPTLDFAEAIGRVLDARDQRILDRVQDIRAAEVDKLVDL